MYSAFLGEGHQSEQLFIHPRTVTIHDAHIIKEDFKDLMVSEEMIQRLLDVNRHSYTLDHKLTLGSPIGFSDDRGQSLSRVAFNSDRGEALFYIRGCKGMFVVKMVKQDNTWKAVRYRGGFRLPQ